MSDTASPLPLAVSICALISSIGAFVMFIFRGGKSSGGHLADIAEIKTKQVTSDTEAKAFRETLGVHIGLHAKQEVINAAQGAINGLRETRENEISQRVSRIEGQHERERHQ